MGDVLTFTPRPEPTAPEILPPLEGAALRASLEEAAQTALDAADRIIAVLDRMDGDADDEDGADAEPSLAAPENPEGSQVGFMRGSGRDGEANAFEVALPEIQADEAVQPKAPAEIPTETADEAETAPNVIEVPPLRWGGRGNVVAAAGTVLLDLAGVR